MRTQAAAKDSAAHATQPFFSERSTPVPAFFSVAPLTVAARAQPEAAEEFEAEQPAAMVQAKLAMGAPGDRFEQEADAMADHVVQRMATRSVRGDGAPAVQAKCAACQEERQVRRQPAPDEEGLLQAKADTAADVPDSVQQSLDGGRGGGQSLSPGLREDMETAFGTDLSGVRVHTGTAAENLSQDLSARAFTHGQDVYFNSGEFRPETPQGQHLLAHELTHVVQQNPGLQRKPRSQPRADAALTATGGKKVQASTYSFGPTFGLPKGTLIHKTVLPMFAEANSDLFVEVKIPGANRRDVETGKWGVADFYKARPAAGDSMSRTIGINFDLDTPSFLTKDRKLEGGGASYRHSKHAAPKGTTRSPRVRELKRGPTHIELGDLKPPNLAEAILGGGQLSNYRSGIVNTAKSLETYLADPRNSGENQDGGTWAPDPVDMATLAIPANLNYPTGAGISRYSLAVYLDGRKINADSGLTGSMFVYKHARPGIWVYEWIPEAIPATTGAGDVNRVLTRLNEDIIEPVQLKPLPRAAPAPIRRRESARLRRKDKKGFPYLNWKGKYNTWKKDAESFLGKPEEKKKGEITEALVDVDKRAGNRLKLPAAVKERGVGFGKIRHWARFGGIYGWLRNTFDGAFVKVKALVEKVKKKVQALAKKAGATSFGSWVKAAAKVIFKIFKLVASWAVGQVANRLIASFEQGISNNLRKLVDAVTPEGVKSTIEEFEERKLEYEEVLKAKEEDLEKRLFGDKLDLFEKLQEWEAIANQASTIITVIEWGVRLIACASPPAIGCLWNLVISALQAAFALLIQTCWFTKKVYEPVLNEIKPVRDFPATIAKFVVEKANGLIRLPKPLEPLFAEIVIDHSGFRADDCPEGGAGASLTPERRAILELVEEIGDAKFRALLDLMMKRGAGPWVLLTAERLAELKAALSEVKTEDLKAAAAQPQSEPPAPLEPFLAGIGQYSKQEKALISESAERKKAAAGGKGSGAGGAAVPDFARPITKAPSAITGKSTPIYSGVTTLREALKPGASYPDAIDISLVIGLHDGQKGYLAYVKPVRVKVQSVSAIEAVFINQQTFYAYYVDAKFVEILKDTVIRIPNDRLLNAAP
jgi:hypothetical protein